MDQPVAQPRKYLTLKLGSENVKLHEHKLTVEKKVVHTEWFVQHRDQRQKGWAFLFACHYGLFDLGILRELFGMVRLVRCLEGYDTGSTKAKSGARRRVRQQARLLGT